MVTGLLTKACVRAELEHAELQISDENKESTSAGSEITIWRIVFCSWVYLSINLGSYERQPIGFLDSDLVLSKMVEESPFSQSLSTPVYICFGLCIRPLVFRKLQAGVEPSESQGGLRGLALSPQI